MTTAILVSQNRAISVARDATTVRETLQLATLAAVALALPGSP